MQATVEQESCIVTENCGEKNEATFKNSTEHRITLVLTWHSQQQSLDDSTLGSVSHKKSE
jgi:ferredoxin